ncbi:TolC family outer membrane protein [Flavimaribacter sediminis]|uniref:TolC family outer membrane protein n=1 Tax=Flavimaribacter sediminis TaxID=2865987 RepID=UPI00278C1D08|nr:TolC family outer membrane protein [Flavimaribacter sediminis]
MAATQGAASAETIFGAMAKAYENNPDLNAARAGLRATDEGVAIAKSGYRPTIVAGVEASRTTTWHSPSQTSTITDNASAGVTITQTLFDGFQTKNNVNAAKSSVFGGRQDLINNEMTILLSAVQIYANLLRDRAIVSARQQNLEFLDEQRNAAQARLDVGEGTRTDVALAQAQLEQARAQLLAAQAAANSSAAVYVQIIGDEPKNLKMPSPYQKGLPSSTTAAVEIGLREHPSILSAQYTVDAAAFNVKSLEGTFLPNVSVQGTVQHSQYGYTTGIIQGNVSVPIYQGGLASAQVRQAKETLGQAQILVDSARRQVQQDVVSMYTNFQASKASIAANQAQVSAAKLALNGVVEEQKVGQSTQLDVLETQTNVLTAQEDLAQSHRDAIVTSYSLLSAMGRLTVNYLNLGVNKYKPEIHYEAVKDKWFGLRTVDGQ